MDLFRSNNGAGRYKETDYETDEEY